MERHLFDAAQAIIQNRSRRISNEDMIDRLRTLYQSRGHLSGLIIDEADDLPSSSRRPRFAFNTPAHAPFVLQVVIVAQARLRIDAVALS